MKRYGCFEISKHTNVYKMFIKIIFLSNCVFVLEIMTLHCCLKYQILRKQTRWFMLNCPSNLITRIFGYGIYTFSMQIFFLTCAVTKMKILKFNTKEETNTKLYRKSSLWQKTLNIVWFSMGYLMKVPYCEMSLKIDRKNIEIVYLTNLYSIN